MSTLLTRREMVKQLAAASLTSVLGPQPGLSKTNAEQRLGVCSISYLLRWPEVDRGKAPLSLVLEFIDRCHALGAGGVQTTIRSDPGFAGQIRSRIETHKMFLQAQISLPRVESDLDRFEAQVSAAREAGAIVARTACLGGRRYEAFANAQAFADFAQQAQQSLLWAEPIVRKHQLRLAVENHKDWQVPDLLRLLEKISSEYVGVCVDTGNSIALLEDPMAVVAAYAPYAFATHLKDMAVREYEKGFLLSEVALGQGFLNLPLMVDTLRRAQPELQFSLEMITRDPLQVPCLDKSYWTTFEKLPGWLLAGTLSMVRAHAALTALPHVTGLSREEQLRAEEDSVRKSLAFAREHLDL